MYRRYLKRSLLAILALLLCWALLIFTVDPFFHYHAPLFGMQPVVDNERYQNPGIASHFDYDSMILGSSMTENFRTGWFDEAFGCSTVKLPFSAARTGGYRHMLQLGYASHELKNVFLGLDNDSLITKPGTYMFPLPEYLYDSDPFNDVEYLFNFSVLEPAWNLAAKNAAGTVEPLEDAYVWDEPGIYGREKVLSQVDWDLENTTWQRDCSAYLSNCEVNLETNLLPFIREHPETRFYIFFPPYSALWWSQMRSSGQVEARMEVWLHTAETLMAYDNVSLYLFMDFDEVVYDLDNYKDYNHYSAEISRQMVGWLREGRGLLTPENVSQRFTEMAEAGLSWSPEKAE